MNKTYRVIFSAARGALMVVNELTSSVQKKGASAIVTAAALTLTSTALMAGTTLVADEGQNVDINIEVPDKNGHGVEANAGEIKTIGSEQSQITISATGKTGIAAYSEGYLTILGQNITLSSPNGKATQAAKGGQLTVGSEATEKTILSSKNEGVYASKENTSVKVNGKDIDITSSKSDGVFASSGANVTVGSENTSTLTIAGTTAICAQQTLNDKPSSVNVQADSIFLKSTSEAAVEAKNGASVTIGHDDTTTTLTSSLGKETGAITAVENASKVTVNGKSLTITAGTNYTNKAISGLFTQNGTALEKPEDTSTITINAADTSITVTSKTNLTDNKKAGAIGLYAISNGKIDVKGNLTVDAEDAILVRGYSTVLINQSGDKTVKLNGNIDFNYNAETSGTTTDANVKIKLTNGDSYWTGRALTTDDSVGEVDYPSDDPNFQIGTKAEGLVLELAGGGIVNGSADAKKLSIKDFTVSGTNNVFKLDKDTVFTGTITFTDANAELVTNLNTAYEVSADDFLTVEGSDEKVLNNATGKLTLAAPDGGTLTIDDAFTYSSDGLKALRDAYINDVNSALELNLSNATLYVAPPAGETGETTMEIPENTTVTLSAKGEQDLSGGADNFTIKGSVNVVADTTEGAVQTQATLNNVSVTGTVSEAASLNLKSVAADAQAITLQNAVLSVGDDGTTPDDEDKVDTQKTTLLTVTKLVADNGARVLVGNKDSIGLIEVDELYSKASSVIFADPAWNEDSALQTVGNASGLAATAVNGAVEGIVAAGENSFVAFGTDLAGARAMINCATVWSEHETGAAIVVAAPITIGGGTIAANPTWKRETDVTASAGKMVVADNAVLVVDQSAAPADGTPLIGGDLSVEGGTVGVINAQEGTLNIAETTSGLTADNLTLDNPFLDAELTNLGFTATVNTDRFAPAVTSFGMQSMTRRIDAAMAASVADRTTFGQISDQPLNLWVDVSGERYEVSSNADFNADMGYAVFGADAGLADNVRVGAAVEYATGSLRAAENGAKNDLDAYGLTVYGIWQPCPKGAIVADLGYIKGSNDLTSDAFTVTGSVDTTMMSAGLRAQYKGSLGAFSLIPSVGVRVSRLETDAFAVSGIDVEKQKQTLVQLPVALRIHAGEANAAGWTVAPSFKIAWVPTFGDKEITLRGVDVDVIDANPVQGTFGIRAVKQNLMLNADLTMGGGEEGASAIGAKLGLAYRF